MPIIILVVSVIVLFVWYNWGRAHARSALSARLDPMLNRFTRRKPCRWHCHDAHTAGLRSFRCDTCGVTAYSSDSRGPTECKRNLRGGL